MLWVGDSPISKRSFTLIWTEPVVQKVLFQFRAVLEHLFYWPREWAITPFHRPNPSLIYIWPLSSGATNLFCCCFLPVVSRIAFLQCFLYRFSSIVFRISSIYKYDWRVDFEIADHTYFCLVHLDSVPRWKSNSMKTTNVNRYGRW